MLISPAFNRIVSAFESAENYVLNGLKDGRIETEPSLTDRLIGAAEIAFEGEIRAGGYSIRIRTLRDRGPGAPEHQFGPDLVGVLTIDTQELSIKKGFLAQAKMAPSREFNVAGRGKRYPDILVRVGSSSERLLSQCYQMLMISPDRFIFVYSDIGIYVVPAVTIAGLHDEMHSHNVGRKIFRWFIEDFLRSFVGDPKLDACNDETLRRLQNSVAASAALMVEVSGSIDRRDTAG